MNPPRIRISWPEGSVVALLTDTPTVAAVLRVLPCEALANTWGDEVYFSVPAVTSLEPGAVQVVDPGTVCFWVEGSSIALPFGPTPVSRGNECRLVSRVNVLGRIEGDPRQLAAIKNGDPIRVERLAPV